MYIPAHHNHGPSQSLHYWEICVLSENQALNMCFRRKKTSSKSAILLCPTYFHSRMACKTRQSEMANTSPYHIPVLGNVPPIKIENLFSWRHFSARSSFYISNWYSYPISSHTKYLKEIVGQVFEIYAIELLGSLPTDEAWVMTSLALHYISIRSTLTYREYYAKCVMIHWILQ